MTEASTKRLSPFPDLSVGGKGELCFGGQSTADLIEKYGTPLYLLNEDRVRANCRRFSAAAAAAFGKDIPVRLLYASKAASFGRMYRIMAEEGMWCDVVSCGEIYTAVAAGFDIGHAFFHSNNKTDDDIEFAMSQGIGYIVADGADELLAINAVAAKRSQKQRVLLRLTPGIDPHTFEAVATGKVDSKFGSAIETGDAEANTRLALSLDGIQLCGFHCHVGSQIFDHTVFSRTAEIMLDFMHRMHSQLGFVTEILDLGGGFGVPYTAAENYPDIGSIFGAVAEILRRECRASDMPCPTVCFEPGRSIVADAGMTLYTAGSVKRLPGVRSYLSVDGGMTDNPRFALYRAPYTLLDADDPLCPANECEPYSVVGRCCESGDILQQDVLLPRTIHRGSHIACLTTGAYNYSMASNYNRIPRPPIVMLSRGESYVAVRRESFADIAALDADAAVTAEMLTH